jgi:hypothetical protein
VIYSCCWFNFFLYNTNNIMGILFVNEFIKGSKIIIFFTFMLLEKNSGEHTSLLWPSVCPSVHRNSYLLNLSSEIDVDQKCSSRKCLSRSIWKAQGHSDNINESNFNISSLNRQRYWHEIFRNVY